METLKFFWLLSRQEPVVPDVHTCLEQHIIKHLHDDIAAAEVLEESSDFGPITIKIGSNPRRAYHSPLSTNLLKTIFKTCHKRRILIKMW